MIINTLSQFLDDLKGFVSQLNPEEYAHPNPVLVSASIGQHIRHILELFECLVLQYPTGKICYDSRKRDLQLEIDPEFALQKIELLKSKLPVKNKKLLLLTTMDGDPIFLQTSYFRELYYNLEHGIHHQAIIKLACNPFPHLQVPENFGVAPSTVKYLASKIST